MRNAALLSLSLLAACSDVVAGPGSEPTDPTGPLYNISGVVVDSLSGEVLQGARVASGPYVANADAAGQWLLSVPGGLTSVTTSPVGYERSTFTFTVRSNAYIALFARRLAPLVQDCVREGQYVHALVTDLQGRKTIERWDQSEAFLVDATGEHRIGAATWTYLPLDYLTYKVTLGPVSADTRAVRWNVYDDQAHKYSGTCEPATALPGE